MGTCLIRTGDDAAVRLSATAVLYFCLCRNPGRCTTCSANAVCIATLPKRSHRVHSGVPSLMGTCLIRTGDDAAVRLSTTAVLYHCLCRNPGHCTTCSANAICIATLPKRRHRVHLGVPSLMGTCLIRTGDVAAVQMTLCQLNVYTGTLVTAGYSRSSRNKS